MGAKFAHCRGHASYVRALSVEVEGLDRIVARRLGELRGRILARSQGPLRSKSHTARRAREVMKQLQAGLVGLVQILEAAKCVLR